MEHFISCERWTHLVPAGLFFPVPGIIEEIDGAMQQAPHWLQFMFFSGMFIFRICFHQSVETQ
jgi:hypothetical protein